MTEKKYSKVDLNENSLSVSFHTDLKKCGPFVLFYTLRFCICEEQNFCGLFLKIL